MIVLYWLSIVALVAFIVSLARAARQQDAAVRKYPPATAPPEEPVTTALERQLAEIVANCYERKAP